MQAGLRYLSATRPFEVDNAEDLVEGRRHVSLNHDDV